MRATLTIQGDPGRDTWAEVRRAGQAAGSCPPAGWGVARVRVRDAHDVDLPTKNGSGNPAEIF